MKLKKEKGDQLKVKDCCCLLWKKEFKGSNGMKLESKYNISILGYDINTCIATVTPEIRFQLKNLMPKKRMNK